MDRSNSDVPLFDDVENPLSHRTPAAARNNNVAPVPSANRRRSTLVNRVRYVLPRWSHRYLALDRSDEGTGGASGANADGQQQSGASSDDPDHAQSPSRGQSTPTLSPRQVPLGTCSILDGTIRRGRWVRSSKSPGVEGATGDNAVCNRKYNVLSFIPLVLYEQFRMFYNTFFLLVALSQLIPALRVGFFWTYFGPLVFVLVVSISKEAFDDFARYQRDTDLNMFAYNVLLRSSNPGEAHTVRVPSQDIRVGDILVLDTDERVPADCVLLHAKSSEAEQQRLSLSEMNASAFPALSRTPSADSEQPLLAAASGDGSIVSADYQTGDSQEHIAPNLFQHEQQNDTLFIRTDQLDGETDWKLRRAVAVTQAVANEGVLLHSQSVIEAEAPKREIYDFVGTFIDPSGVREPLTLENTLWANTVVASGRAICVVVYNGNETRSRLNASNPRSKVGKLDHEVNRVSKMLFMLLFSLSALLTGLRGFTGQWILYFCRYFLLLSAIIPISMRVNLDMAKIVYSMFVENDKKMPGCTVRNSNLPEELGRIEYIMSDKTGTLTQNEMSFKKLHLGSMLFARDALDDIHQYCKAAFQHDESVKEMRIAAEPSLPDELDDHSILTSVSGLWPRDPHNTTSRRVQKQVQDALIAIAVAHNVTPVEEAGQHTLQAASPDEVALMKFAESVGFFLKERSMNRIVLKVPGGYEHSFDILAEFPFTSEAKRMGVIIQDRQLGVITLYVKGADTIMAKKVRYNDWLEEECGNLAREGLRTLVYAKRELSRAEHAQFAERWHLARTSSFSRKESMNAVQSDLEHDMRLLALTGVEDKLQARVRETLEKLRHAGIRIWMLTGDKVETATCIAVSSRLAERSQVIYRMTGIASRNEASRALTRFRRHARTDVLVVDGASLQYFLDFFAEDFITVAAMCPAAIACRCSPTQKAAVVRLLQTHLGKRVAAIGDGGNDVGMIQEAHAGIGIPGKEGMQASMAADFSITAFSHLTRLLLWHGRNSYKRSARLAQFVIHRGLIISIIQTVYCALFFYAAVSVYSGWILVGYATVFTMFPVFSLILDEDVSQHAADTYPELYKDLQKGRSLNLKTFLIWVFKSIYQGTMIMVFSVYVIWDDEYFTTLHLSAISFTSLILTELLMVAFEVHTWHWMMIAAEMCSILFYIISIFVLQDTFDHSLIFQWGFLARVLVVTLVSCLPVTIGKWLKRKYAPAPYAKLA